MGKLFGCWVILHAFLLSADFFYLFLRKINFFKKNLSLSKNLDLDQAQQNVRPNLGPNCLRRLSTGGTGRSMFV